jgi:hypothetical protein
MRKRSRTTVCYATGSKFGSCLIIGVLLFFNARFNGPIFSKNGKYIAKSNAYRFSKYHSFSVLCIFNAYVSFCFGIFTDSDLTIEQTQFLI